MYRLISTVCLVAVSSFAHAEKADKFGDLEIHYNAISTQDLLPEVARAYNIDRSKTRGLVTMSVLKKSGPGMGTPLPATLKVHVVNQNQQLANIAMREVKEGTAIYYLGEFRMAPNDTLTFNAAVNPRGGPQRDVKFVQKFYE